MTNFYVTCTDCNETNDQGINWGGEQIKRIAAAWPALRAVLDLVVDSAVSGIRAGNQKCR